MAPDSHSADSHSADSHSADSHSAVFHSAEFTPPLPRILQHPNTTSTLPRLIAHGAEAHLYKTTSFVPRSTSPFLATAAALKSRPPKSYRHPVLDARLTRHRILSEARILARCRRDGVPVPGILAVDEAAGWLLMEWVAGEVVRAAINRWLDASEEKALSTPKAGAAAPRESEQDGSSAGAGAGADTDQGGAVASLRSALRRIGEAVGALHKSGVVHGDLTTSNMMLRPRGRQAAEPEDAGDAGTDILAGDVVLIDFGLAAQSSHDEDRAVDLYVLERAFGSTHPRVEHLFAAEVITAYGKAYKGAPTVLKRLDEVRMRGRKRSMVG